jgi:osmoprotectant transport system substrate-binding protein
VRTGRGGRGGHEVHIARAIRVAASAFLLLVAGCRGNAAGDAASTTPTASASGPPVALASAFPPPAAGAAPPSPAARGSRGPLTLGSAGFTESEVLTSLYSALLTSAGYTTKVTREPATDVLESDLEKGTVAVVPHYAADYTEQLNTLVHGAKATPVASSDLAATMAQLSALAAARNVRALTPTAAVDGPAFAVTQKFAAANHLTTMSDLAGLGIAIRLAASPDCATDPQCQPGLLSTYGLKVGTLDPLGLGTAAAIRHVVNHQDQVVQVLTTDATLTDNKLVILTDDKHLQLANNVVPVVSLKAVVGKPDIATVLNRLAPVLTTADLAFMDKLVDAGHNPPDDVAKAYLTSKRLL